jgi:hypothetical protein
MMARDLARVSVAKMTERDVRAAKKAAIGYGYLVRELDGLLTTMLNGPNDHLMPELDSVLDALAMLKKVQDAQEREAELPPDLQKILMDELETAYNKKFGETR